MDIVQILSLFFLGILFLLLLFKKSNNRRLNKNLEEMYTVKTTKCGVEYRLYGQLHRKDVPALELFNGAKCWYINGKKLTEEEFNKLKKNKVERIEIKDGVEYRLNGDLHREDGPAIEYKNGTKFWYINGKLHREDGPAIEYVSGTKEWWVDGKLHRTDGPAIIFHYGNKCWYINGKRHREDGPAVEAFDGEKHWYINNKLHREDGPALELKNGDKYWYINNQLHRIDGPAIEYNNGRKHWCINDKLHREDGPAIEFPNGGKEWYIEGKKLTEEEFNKLKKVERVKYRNRVEYKLNGVLHREDGPAIEFVNGTKHWYINGQQHREDGPAIESTAGLKYWYINGKLHREDGPAVEWKDGTKFWYINNKKLTEEEFNKLKKNKVERTEYEDRVEYRLNGRLHREDGPAIEWKNGIKEWVFNGKLHREDGPAVEWTNGLKSWYIKGEPLTEEEFNKLKKNKVEKIEYENRIEYRLNGDLHRQDGPAIEFRRIPPNGGKEWYIDYGRM